MPHEKCGVPYFNTALQLEHSKERGTSWAYKLPEIRDPLGREVKVKSRTSLLSGETNFIRFDET